MDAYMQIAKMQISWGLYDNALVTLNVSLRQAENDSVHQALVFVLIGNVLCHQNKYAESKSYLETSCGILDKKETLSPVLAGSAYAEMATLYDTMDEFETAISLLKRAVALFEKQTEEQHMAGTLSARIGWMLFMRGEVQQAIPYMESAVEVLKESTHCFAGYNYNNLGAAYLELERPDSAAQMFTVAKEIIASGDPHHPDSVVVCQNLSKAYTATGNYTLAIELQQQVIDALKGHGPSAKDELREARLILEELKKKKKEDDLGTSTKELNKKKKMEKKNEKEKKAIGTSTNQIPTKAVPLPRNHMRLPLPVIF